MAETPGGSSMIMAGHQPNYLPWLGFFDKMNKCDVFVIEDAVQFIYHEFQNRNRVKTNNGVRWLTVPVKEGRKRKKFSEILISNEKNWSRGHWLTLKMNYGNSPYWDEFCNFFEETYNKKWEKLIDLNLHLIKGIMDFLDIEKELILASSLNVSGEKCDLIIAQCKILGAETYLSGTGALTYMDIDKFKGEGIDVVFQEFEHPTYPQLWGEFIENLSIVDYLFCATSKLSTKN